MRSHPLVWSVPVMLVLVVVAMPFNSGFYEQFVNFDPQGPDEQWEWNHTLFVYRHTSGLLLGQILSLAVGFLLTRRHGPRAAGLIGVPLSLVLAVAGLTLATTLATKPRTYGFDLPWSVISAEVAAYPLAMLIGIGLAGLVTRYRMPRRYVIAIAVFGAWVWLIMTVVGLTDSGMETPAWQLTLLPPLAAAAAIGSSALSRDVYDNPIDLESDWGSSASVTLLIGLLTYAVVVNLLAHVRLRSLFARTGDR